MPIITSLAPFTCAVVAPFFTSTILPLSRLRALIFMTPLLKSAISRPQRIGVGEEQFLPVDLVIRDRLLALGRDEPVDEGLAERLLYVWMLFGIDQHDAVLVEQALVAGTRISRSPRFLNESQVPRSAST